MINRLLTLIFLISTFVGISGVQEANSADKKIIYSIFWAECEEVCEGLKDYIKNTNLDAELVVREAGRDKTKFPGFVKEARSMGAAVVTTWGTTTTLGIIGTLDDTKNDRFLNDIPVVFTMVSDPVRSRIIESYEKTGRSNITGTRNRVPESMNINIIRKIQPSFKKLGIIYNQSEKNSMLKVKEVESLQHSLGFELVSVELDADENGKPIKEAIPDRVKELKDKNVDFIYLGSSVFLEDNMNVFTGAAVEQGLPILSPYESLVRDSQAYLSVAAKEYDVGLLAGKQITKIIVEGISPGDISVISVDQYAYVVNMSTAKKINLYPTFDILQISEIVK